MSSVSFSQQVEVAIVITQYWVRTTYLNSYFQQALEHPFDAANVCARLLGPIVTLAGSVFLWLNYTIERSKYIQEKEKNNNEAKLAESRLLSERFHKAIEQLGNENIHIRLGGIYSLEKIAKDNPDEHWSIMEVLTAFIRECAPLRRTQQENTDERTSGATTDIQAALIVLNRRQRKNDKGHILDLHSIDISNTDLRGIDFSNIDLTRANLSHVQLSGADLTGATLVGADLRRAQLDDAILCKASLVQSDIRGANLSGAKLIEASLILAHLEHADLKRADLNNAHLTSANLSYADLYGANLEGVEVTNTIFLSPNRAIADLNEFQDDGVLDSIKAGLFTTGTIMPNGKVYDEAISIEKQFALPKPPSKKA